MTGILVRWIPSGLGTVGPKTRLPCRGDYYQGNFEQNLVAPTFVQPYSERQLAKINAEATGGSLPERVGEHQYSATSQMGLQVYYQYADREELLYIADTDTLDLDSRLISPWTIDKIVWGWLSAQSGSLHRYHPGDRRSPTAQRRNCSAPLSRIKST